MQNGGLIMKRTIAVTLTLLLVFVFSWHGTSAQQATSQDTPKARREAAKAKKEAQLKFLHGQFTNDDLMMGTIDAVMSIDVVSGFYKYVEPEKELLLTGTAIVNEQGCDTYMHDVQRAQTMRANISWCDSESDVALQAVFKNQSLGIETNFSDRFSFAEYETEGKE
jgi:hypothetical protein